MAVLTQEQLNKIIDSSKDHAKTVCERIYNKTVEEIGPNEQFKTILDNVFDKVADLEIQGLKDWFGEYFIISKSTEINTVDITTLTFERKKVMQIMNNAGRGHGKVFTMVAFTVINQSVLQAFTEKLAEYLGIKIKEGKICQKKTWKWLNKKRLKLSNLLKIFKK